MPRRVPELSALAVKRLDIPATRTTRHSRSAASRPPLADQPDRRPIVDTQNPDRREATARRSRRVSRRSARRSAGARPRGEGRHSAGRQGVTRGAEEGRHGGAGGLSEARDHLRPMPSTSSSPRSSRSSGTRSTGNSGARRSTPTRGRRSATCLSATFASRTCSVSCSRYGARRPRRHRGFAGGSRALLPGRPWPDTARATTSTNSPRDSAAQASATVEVDLPTCREQRHSRNAAALCRKSRCHGDSYRLSQSRSRAARADT